jgi:L-amino acid N-acyltransferase YncA
MNLLIRKATSDDAEAIIRIFNPIINSGLYTVLGKPFTVEEEQKFIENFPQRGVFHVAVCPETHRILGFQTIEPFADFTHAFDHVAGVGTFIDLSLRGRGIGTRLSEATFEVARQSGFEKIFTYVRADNAASLRFHLKLGFNIIGNARRQARIRGTYIDEIIIEKFL